MLKVSQVKTQDYARSLAHLHVEPYPQCPSRQKLVDAAIWQTVEIAAQDDGEVPRHHELLKLWLSADTHAMFKSNTRRGYQCRLSVCRFLWS